MFRYAARLALAMMAGGIVAVELGGERHGNWVLLTISVILRAGYGLTRQRRDDRVIGTLIGCVIASAAVAYSPAWGLIVLQAVALAMAHGFARLNYRVASIGASMMALVSLHLAEPNFPSPILARLTDTLIGAAIAHLFSFVLPNWEITEAPKIARRLKERTAGFADFALRADASDHDYRLARKDFMEALAALSDSAARMGGEPRSARRALDEVSAMVIAASIVAANVSAARFDALDAGAPEGLEAERRLARETMTGRPPPQGSRLAESVAEFVAAADAYERAARARRRFAGSLSSAHESAHGGAPMSVIAFDRPDFLREEEIVLFEDSVGKFFDQHAPEERVAKWRRDRIVEREMWSEAGAAGLLCLSMPEAYGGAGGDYRHEVVLMEQLAKKGVDGFGASLHNAIVAPYILHYGTEEQKRKLAAAHGDRRTRRRHRDDRAGRRLRPAGREDHRQEGRQPICDQRPEDLHHQRPDRQSDHRRRQDRSRRRRQGHVADRRRDRRGRRLRARPQARQDRPGRAGHLGAVLRRRAACRPPTCSAARRARASSS